MAFRFGDSKSYNAKGFVAAAAGTFDSAGTLLEKGISIPAGTCLILIVPEGQAIRFRDDGQAPVAGVGGGIPVAALEKLYYDVAQLPELRIIGQVAGGVVNFAFYG